MNKRTQAAYKAWDTRRERQAARERAAEAAKRSEAARKAWRTRRANTVSA